MCRQRDWLSCVVANELIALSFVRHFAQGGSKLHLSNFVVGAPHLVASHDFPLRLILELIDLKALAVHACRLGLWGTFRRWRVYPEAPLHRRLSLQGACLLRNWHPKRLNTSGEPVTNRES